MKYWAPTVITLHWPASRCPLSTSSWPLGLGASATLLHRGYDNLCCFWEHRQLGSSPYRVTSFSPSTPFREKDIDPHHSQSAPFVPFSVLQKLLAFLVPTSLFSRHASSSPPLECQPQRPARDYAKRPPQKVRTCPPAIQTSPTGNRNQCRLAPWNEEKEKL